MNARDAFYLTCGLMMVVGLVIFSVGGLLSKRFERTGGVLLLLGLLCFLVGPFMALIGPNGSPQ